jgi:hypothetical protein
VAPLALLGLAVLASTAVPAVVEHRRLETWHSRLLEEAHAEEQEVLRLAKRLKAARTDRYVRERELDRILNPEPEPTRASPGPATPPRR